MTLEEIVNNLKSAGQDYGQLFNNNPRMDNFASVLQQGLGQLIPSNADFKSPEAMRDWGTAAALNAPMGLTFTGPKSMGWNHDAANTATKLLDNGADPAQVWKDHLIGRMPDKSLFSEIDDSGAKFNPTDWISSYKDQPDFKSSTIGEALNHKELKSAYPDIMSLDLHLNPRMGSKANWNQASEYSGMPGYMQLNEYLPDRIADNKQWLDRLNNKDQFKKYVRDDIKEYGETARDAINYYKGEKASAKNNINNLKLGILPDTNKTVAAHELQHAIQEKEGWARGGSHNEFKTHKFQPYNYQELRDAAILDKMSYHNDNILDALNNFEKEFGRKPVPGAESALERIGRGKVLDEARDQVKLTVDPYNSYLRLTGEAQARATQDRMNMNMQQRRDNYPLAGDKLSDIPLDQLINRYR